MTNWSSLHHLIFTTITIGFHHYPEVEGHDFGRIAFIDARFHLTMDIIEDVISAPLGTQRVPGLVGQGGTGGYLQKSTLKKPVFWIAEFLNIRAIHLQHALSSNYY